MSMIKSVMMAMRMSHINKTDWSKHFQLVPVTPDVSTISQ